MLDEDETRRLLVLAGQTVPEPEERALPAASAPRPRRWTALAVAATVAALVGTTWAVLQDRDPSGGDGVPMVTDGVPEGRVPSVFGYDQDAAVAMLEGRGYDVEVEKKERCEPPGRALETSPEVGRPAAEGSTVQLFVATTGPALDCAYGPEREEAWRFLDFANGRGPAPKFADEVTVLVNDGPARVIGDPTSPAAWGSPSALSVLAEASSGVQSFDGGRRWLVPDLSTEVATPPTQTCGNARPASVGTREALLLRVFISDTNALMTCPATVAVYTKAGEIDTVVTSSPKPGRAVPANALPDVLGQPLAEAREILGSAGFSVKTEQHPTCFPKAGVTEQAPSPQDVRDDAEDDPFDTGRPVTLVTDVLDPARDCAALKQVAQQLVAFASGSGPAPDVAPEVRLLRGYTVEDTITAAEAATYGGWNPQCPLAGRMCPPLGLLMGGDRTVTYGDEAPFVDDESLWDCHEDRGGLPQDLYGEEKIVILPVTLPTTCAEAWEVWVWVDDAGRLRAVNSMLPAG